MSNSQVGLSQKLIDAWLSSGCYRPFVVGIAGPPAAGKTTLSELLVSEINAAGISALALQMDGFHLQNSELKDLGLTKYKGRQDTFDAISLLGAVRKLKGSSSEFWWPTYSRELHNPISEGVLVKPTVEIAILEGNYLLVDSGIWADIGRELDFKIFLDVDDFDITSRLVQRHLAGGRSEVEAYEKIRQSDLVNATYIRGTASFSSIDEIIAE